MMRGGNRYGYDDGDGAAPCMAHGDSRGVRGACACALFGALAVLALLASVMVIAFSALPDVGSMRAGLVGTGHAVVAGPPSVEHAVVQTADVSQKTPAAPTDYDSWSAVSQDIGRQLDEALRIYGSGDSVSARAQMSQAQNVTYIASNFVSQVSATLGAERSSQQTQEFQSIESLAQTPGNDAALSSQAETLKQDLTDASASLDGAAGVAKPRDYAKELAAKRQAERRRLQKEKKTKFTGKGSRSWTDVAKEMGVILDDAVKATKAGDARKGSDKVNEAYYQYYEKLGFEKNVMNAISGSRVSLVESTFKDCRKSMIRGESIKTVQGHVNTLKTMLVEDARQLDGGAQENVGGFTRFITSSVGQAFIILVREGLEALLVVAAIIAYLAKSGNKRLVKWIYVGVLAGLLGSGLVAMLFGVLFSGNGPQQEIMEGVVALIAMVMLLYTSNWMLSKSGVDKWNDYIREKTEKTVQGISGEERLTLSGVVSLAMLSFLAVFREGAETVMFYESIYSMTQDSKGMWLGGLAAVAALVIIFVIFRLTSVRIPIRPFFVVTSVLMALLVVIFAGGGVHSLIEGNLIAGTYLQGVPTSDWLGLYPYAETITVQAFMAVVVVALYVVFAIRERSERRQEENGGDERNGGGTVQVRAGVIHKDVVGVPASGDSVFPVNGNQHNQDEKE